MKKLFLIGVGIVLAVAIFGVAGFAYAQTLELSATQVQEPPEPLITDGPEFPYGRAGWCRGSRGGNMNAVPAGLMGFGLDEDEFGLLHDYLWTAIAESFGLTNEQIEAFENVQETIKDIREELTQEELRNTMKQAMAVAIESALVDGAITEDQADVQLERLEQMEVMPFGSGKAGNFRQGFSHGVKFGRQMMANHEYLDAAIAEMLGVSVEDLQEIKTEQGFNFKGFR